MVDKGLLGKPRCMITLIRVLAEKRAYCLNPYMLKFNPYKYEKYPFLSALTLGELIKPT